MSYELALFSNSLCGDLPTELASLLANFDDTIVALAEITQDNFIGSPCSSSGSTDDADGPKDGPNTTVRAREVAATMWVLVGCAFTLVLGLLVANRNFCAERHSDNASSNMTAIRNLEVEVHDRLNSAAVEMLFGQPFLQAWQNSDMQGLQLVILDDKLRVVL